MRLLDEITRIDCRSLQVEVFIAESTCAAHWTTTQAVHTLETLYQTLFVVQKCACNMSMKVELENIGVRYFTRTDGTRE